MGAATRQVRCDIVQLPESAAESDVSLVIEAGVAEDEDAVLYIIVPRRRGSSEKE